MLSLDWTLRLAMDVLAEGTAAKLDESSKDAAATAAVFDGSSVTFAAAEVAEPMGGGLVCSLVLCADVPPRPCRM